MVSISFVRILMPRLKMYLSLDSRIVDYTLISTEASTLVALVADVKEKCGELWRLSDNFLLYLAPKGCLDDPTEHAALQNDEDVGMLITDDNLVIYDGQEASFERSAEVPEAYVKQDQWMSTADASNDLEIHISGIGAKNSRKEVRDYLERFGPIKKLYMPPRHPWDTHAFTYADVTLDRTTAETLLTKQTSVVYNKVWTYSLAKGVMSRVDATSRGRSRSRERSLKGGDGKKGRYGYQGGKRK